MTLTAEIFRQYTAPAWMSEARCRDSDPALFFPEPGDKDNIRRTNAAKRICRHCPVRKQCLAYAFETGDRFAVLGGTTAYQRTRMISLKKRFRPGGGRFTVRRKKSLPSREEKPHPGGEPEISPPGFFPRIDCLIRLLVREVPSPLQFPFV